MKRISSLVLVMLFIACSSVRADDKKAEEKPTPPPPKVQVFGANKEVVAEIDPASGKTTYYKGGDDTLVIGALLKQIEAMGNYHQSFKADLASVLPGCVKKVDEKQKKAAEKK